MIESLIAAREENDDDEIQQGESGLEAEREF
jgi:hypothetical protein